MKEVQRILNVWMVDCLDDAVLGCVRELIAGEKKVGRFLLDVTTAMDEVGLDEQTKIPVYRITVRLIEEGEKTNGAKG